MAFSLPAGYTWLDVSANDIPQIAAIEARAYEFPWTESMLSECLHGNHLTRAIVCQPNASTAVSDSGIVTNDIVANRIVAYGIVAYGADEAHLLNLCVAPDFQGNQLGRFLLLQLMSDARRYAHTLYLEVRASNRVAAALYHSVGFQEVGRRKHYYRGRNGREDALVFALDLAS